MIQPVDRLEGYQTRILESLMAAGIRQLSPGGKARALADAVASELAGLDAAMFARFSQTLLPYATGENLDALGAIFGVYRIPQQTVELTAADRNFVFYVPGGTFGSINNGQDIVIPAGTRIFPASGTSPVYITDELILPAGDSEFYFGARAMDSGASANVAPNTLVRHNFTGYADAIFGSLLVTNRAAIVSGRDEEDDDSYRYRIRLKLTSPSSVTENGIRFALLQLPGVQDIVFKPEPGRVTCYLYSIAVYPDPGLLDQAQSVLDEHLAFPLHGRVVAPEVVGISLHTTIRVSGSVTAAEKDVIVGNAVSAVREYVNNLGIRETLYINRIAEVILNADPRIVDIGAPNRQIQGIYIWRSRTNGQRYSRTLLGNYAPQFGERVAIESSLQNPISIVVQE